MPTIAQKNIAILISGGGSNMLAIANAIAQDTHFPANIVCVISDKENAKGLDIADKLGINTHFIDSNINDAPQAHEQKVHDLLTNYDADYVCLAGYMRILSPFLCDLWEGKMLNIHPSLLPSFKGLKTHQRALDAGVKFSGCTIHWVTAQLDAGEIIAQAAVPVCDNDTADILAARILSVEHQLYPKVLKALCLEEKIDHAFSFYQQETNKYTQQEFVCLK